MRKIRLNLDALEVASFDTQPKADGNNGSVHANVKVPPGTSTQCETNEIPSCWVTQCVDAIWSCGGASCNCTSPSIGPVICH